MRVRSASSPPISPIEKNKIAVAMTQGGLYRSTFAELLAVYAAQNWAAEVSTNIYILGVVISPRE